MTTDARRLTNRLLEAGHQHLYPISEMTLNRLDQIALAVVSQIIGDQVSKIFELTHAKPLSKCTVEKILGKFRLRVDTTFNLISKHLVNNYNDQFCKIQTEQIHIWMILFFFFRKVISLVKKLHFYWKFPGSAVVSFQLIDVISTSHIQSAYNTTVDYV